MSAALAECGPHGKHAGRGAERLRDVAQAPRTQAAQDLRRELSGARNEFERWQGGETQELVFQMRCGSVGITLVRPSGITYYSLSTNLAAHAQLKL